jgi:hypothetical protein
MNIIRKFVCGFRTLENQTTLKKILTGITYFSIFGLCIFLFVKVPYLIGCLAIKNSNWSFRHDEPWGVGFVVTILFLVLLLIHILHIAIYVGCIMSTEVTKKFKKNEFSHMREDLWILSENMIGYDHESNLYSHQYSYLSLSEVIRITIAYLTSFLVVCFLICITKLFYATMVYFFGSFVIDIILIMIVMVIRNIQTILSKSK